MYVVRWGKYEWKEDGTRGARRHRGSKMSEDPLYAVMDFVKRDDDNRWDWVELIADKT